MSCIFRVVGKKLEIDSLLKKVNLEPYRFWHKGEKKTKNKKYTHSGACFAASNAEHWEFKLQVEDAIHFLESFKKDIEVIVAFPGVEEPTLDFGIELQESFLNCDLLPPKLLRLAGNLNIAIELSHYPPGKEEEPEKIKS